MSDELNSDNEEPNSLLINPLTSLVDNDTRKERVTYNLGAAFTWEIIKNLRLKTEFGYDDYRYNTDRYYGPSTYYVRNTPSSNNQGKPAASLTRQSRNTIRNTNTVNYDFEKLLKSEKHHLNVLLGQEYVIAKNNKITNTSHGFPETFTAGQLFQFNDTRYSSKLQIILNLMIFYFHISVVSTMTIQVNIYSVQLSVLTVLLNSPVEIDGVIFHQQL